MDNPKFEGREIEIGQRAAELAIGRILRMGSRPEQPGDVAEYNRCRAIVLEYTENERKHGRL